METEATVEPALRSGITFLSPKCFRTVPVPELSFETAPRAPSGVGVTVLASGLLAAAHGNVSPRRDPACFSLAPEPFAHSQTGAIPDFPATHHCLPLGRLR